jgi:hypothetical protein
MGIEVVTVWRAISAGASVVLAAVCGVVTALVTAHPSRGLWVALAAVVVVGAVSQAAVTYSERGERGRVEASGAGAVAVGGSAPGDIRTRVRGELVPPTAQDGREGVIASGPGSVSIHGDAGSITTNVTTDPGQGGHHMGSP